MKTRILVGALIAAMYVLVFVLGSPAVQAAAVAVFALIAQWEMLQAMKAGGHKPMAFGGYAFAALVAPAAWFCGALGVVAVWVVCVMLIFAVRVLSRKVSTQDMLWSLLPLAYPMPLFGIMALTVALGDPMGRTLLVYTIAVVCITDVMAYFIGRAFGRHKLSPELSPKKSVEGAVGGLAGGIIAGIAMYYVQGYLGASLPVWVFVACAPVCSVFGQIGDLAASSLKREMKIKDYGKLFPGHGGVLDRFDSLLFALPIVYLAYVGAKTLSLL